MIGDSSMQAGIRFRYVGTETEGRPIGNWSREEWTGPNQSRGMSRTEKAFRQRPLPELHLSDSDTLRRVIAAGWFTLALQVNRTEVVVQVNSCRFLPIKQTEHVARRTASVQVGGCAGVVRTRLLRKWRQAILIRYQVLPKWAQPSRLRVVGRDLHVSGSNSCRDVLGRKACGHTTANQCSLSAGSVESRVLSREVQDQCKNRAC